MKISRIPGNQRETSQASSRRPMAPCGLKHAMPLLGRTLRRALVYHGHEEAMTTCTGLCTESLQVAIFVDRFVDIGYG